MYFIYCLTCSLSACGSPDGGWFDSAPGCPGGTQFDPPAAGLAGYGELVAAPGDPTLLFSIGDNLQIPGITHDILISFG